MSRPSAMHCPHCDAHEHELRAERGLAGGSARCRRCGRSLAVCNGFVLGREVGRGGVARVREALRSDGRDASPPAVVKVLERTAFNPWQVHQLFARSARLAQAFDHVGLPKVLGFERTGDRSFLAMEQLTGGTLSERVVARNFARGARFEALLRGLLEVAAYLHDRDYVHGDITPRNVMFRTEQDWQPVLIDLDGLCSPDEHGLPSLVMTPGYTAPEQKAGQVSEVTDLYGIGATMIYAATGRSPDQLDRTGSDRALAVSLPDVSPDVRMLVQRLVDLDPRRRPRSARAALRVLARRTRLRPALATLVAAAAVLLFLLSVAVVTHAASLR